MRTDEEGIDVVGEKLADLVFGEVKAEEWVALGEVEDVMQKVTLRGGPWVDGEGSHAVGMCVWVGRRTCWFVLLQPIVSLFKQIGSTETMSRCSRASPKRRKTDQEKYNRQLSHQIDRVGEGRGEICSDEFWPVVEMNGVA